jgi:hypothetical protein
MSLTFSIFTNHEYKDSIRFLHNKMGSSNSKYPSVDLSKLEYALSGGGHYHNGGYTYFVKWNTVPEDIKKQMKQEVAKCLDGQKPLSETIPFLLFPKYIFYLRRPSFFCCQPYNIGILYKHAILEYLKETNLDIPFTLTSNKKEWYVNYIYNVSEKYKEKHDIENIYD